MPRRHSHLPRSALFDRVGHLQLPTEQLVANMGSGFRVLRLFAFSVWSLGSRVKLRRLASFFVSDVYDGLEPWADTNPANHELQRI